MRKSKKLTNRIKFSAAVGLSSMLAAATLSITACSSSEKLKIEDIQISGSNQININKDLNFKQYTPFSAKVLPSTIDQKVIWSLTDAPNGISIDQQGKIRIDKTIDPRVEAGDYPIKVVATSNYDNSFSKSYDVVLTFEQWRPDPTKIDIYGGQPEIYAIYEGTAGYTEPFKTRIYPSDADARVKWSLSADAPEGLAINEDTGIVYFNTEGQSRLQPTNSTVVKIIATSFVEPSITSTATALLIVDPWKPTKITVNGSNDPISITQGQTTSRNYSVNIEPQEAQNSPIKWIETGEHYKGISINSATGEFKIAQSIEPKDSPYEFKFRAVSNYDNKIVSDEISFPITINYILPTSINIQDGVDALTINEGDATETEYTVKINGPTEACQFVKWETTTPTDGIIIDQETGKLIITGLKYRTTPYEYTIIATSIASKDIYDTKTINIQVNQQDTIGERFDESYFNNDSSIYNPSLATFAAYAAQESRTYLEDYSQGDKYIKDFLTKDSRFTDFVSNEFYKIKPQRDTMGVAAAKRELQDGSTLIAIILRSQDYEAEWVDNANVYTEGYPQEYHTGFYKGSEKAINHLKQYIQDHNLVGKKIKLWVTGYSRGGAVGNLTSARINQAIKAGIFENDFGAKLAKTDFYSYCFATPNNVDVNTFEGDWTGEDYDNLFNIINPHDIVPNLPPFELGFDHFGKNKYICSKWTDEEKYNMYKKEAINTYENEFINGPYSIDDWVYDGVVTTESTAELFKNYSMENTTRYTVKFLSKLLNNSKAYYVSNYQEEIMSLLSDLFETGEGITVGAIVDIFLLLLGDGGLDTRFLISAMTIKKNVQAILDAHLITLYAGWCKTADPKYHAVDSTLNEFLDDFSYYKIETEDYNQIQIYDSDKSYMYAEINGYPTEIAPDTMSNDKDVGVGIYWQAQFSDYGEAYFKKLDYQIRYSGAVSMPHTNCKIVLYKVTPKYHIMIKEETGTLYPWSGWYWFQMS